MRKFRAMAGLLLVLVALCGCGQQELTLSDVAVTVTEELDNGATLTIPGDWEVLSTTDESAVFANADNTLSLGVMRELAGYSYYSPEELAGLGEDLLAAELENIEVQERLALGKPDNAVLVTATGQRGEAAVVAQAVVISPLSAVRYFIVVTANSDAFEENRQLLSDIYGTFELNMTEDELYQLFDDSDK